jgi:diadenylate cyclase
MFIRLLNAVQHFTWVDGLDILVVAIILYSFLRLIKDTRAYQMAIGLAMIGLSASPTA